MDIQPCVAFLTGVGPSYLIPIQSELDSPRGGWFLEDREGQDARDQVKLTLSLPEFSLDRVCCPLGVRSGLLHCAATQIFIKPSFSFNQLNLYVLNTDFLFKNIRWHPNIYFLLCFFHWFLPETDKNLLLIMFMSFTSNIVFNNDSYQISLFVENECKAKKKCHFHILNYFMQARSSHSKELFRFLKT